MPDPTTDHVTYEITYDVRDGHREEYEACIGEAVLGCAQQRSIVGFHAAENESGDGPCIRLTFEFRSLSDWLSFLESETYRSHLDELEAHVEALSATVWEPIGIAIRSTSHS